MNARACVFVCVCNKKKLKKKKKKEIYCNKIGNSVTLRYCLLLSFSHWNPEWKSFNFTAHRALTCWKHLDWSRFVYDSFTALYLCAPHYQLTLLWFGAAFFENKFNTTRFIHLSVLFDNIFIQLSLNFLFLMCHTNCERARVQLCVYCERLIASTNLKWTWAGRAEIVRWSKFLTPHPHPRTQLNPSGLVQSGLVQSLLMILFGPPKTCYTFISTQLMNKPLKLTFTTDKWNTQSSDKEKWGEREEEKNWTKIWYIVAPVAATAIETVVLYVCVVCVLIAHGHTHFVNDLILSPILIEKNGSTFRRRKEEW